MPPLPRFNTLDVERQESLLNVAAREFGDNGFKSASLNRIVKTAGLSKGAFYYYFDNKADLYDTVVERAIKGALKHLGDFNIDALEVDTFWPTLEATALRMLDFAIDRPWMISAARVLYRAETETLPSAPKGLRSTSADFTGLILKRGQALGLVRNDMPLELLTLLVYRVGETTDMWAIANWDTLEPEHARELSHQTIDIMRRIVAPVLTP
ncbi:MAG: AcrR family transcriptional regulator [Flavobacteriales bacterium]|jgi:AcrR family transcriptional regulator